MIPFSKALVSRLREIGWKLWDPIGLADQLGMPPEHAADEYDRYLLDVASMLDRGASKTEAAGYLTGVASESMGLADVDSDAVEATVDAIADYLMSLTERPKPS